MKESGVIVEVQDLEEEEKRKLLAASIAPSQVASPIKERKAEVLASEKKKKKEEYITAKDFAQIKGEIDEENSIPLDNKVKLKSGINYFTSIMIVHFYVSRKMHEIMLLV